MRWVGLSAAILLSLAMSGPAQSAGTAYAVDDAEIGKPGSCQNETWASVATSHDFSGVTAPACVVTIALPVELTALYQRAATAGEWSTTLTGQAKIVPVDTGKFAVGMLAGSFWDSATGTVSGYVNMPFSFKFGRDFRTHVDAGFLHDSRVDVDYLTSGIGFEWDFVPNRFSLQGEVYLQEGREPGDVPATITAPRPQLGLRWMPVANVDVDFIYGNNITGRTANWLTLGLTVRTP